MQQLVAPHKTMTAGTQKAFVKNAMVMKFAVIIPVDDPRIVKAIPHLLDDNPRNLHQPQNVIRLKDFFVLFRHAVPAKLI